MNRSTRRPWLPAARVALAAAMSLLGADAAMAACTDALDAAPAQYAAGQFQTVIDSLRKECPVSGVAREDRKRAYEMRARAHLALLEFSNAQAMVDLILRLDADYAPVGAGDGLLAEMADRTRRTLVRSVSKIAEDVHDAPATVVVVTADSIRRRGYLDVETVLHDLPGFDITRGNGDQYANIYQRGYRSNATDRTLVLVDGVEQNDLHSNIAYLSRQYPVSNIDRIEVVYGPASTIYGPNAFSGVINIITKEPDLMIETGRLHAVSAHVARADFNSNLIEATYSGRATRTSVGSWSVTGRFYASDEPNLAKLAAGDPNSTWAYDYPGVFDRFDYVPALGIGGKTLDRMLCQDTAATGVLERPERCALPSAAVGQLAQAFALGLAETRGSGDTLVLVPTALGIARARELDKAMWAREIGRPYQYSDPTRDSYVSAKMKLPEFTLGFQTWTAKEGTTPWYSTRMRGDGGIWAPRQTSIYSTYRRSVRESVILNVLARYKNDQVRPSSRIPLMATYASGYLGLLDLVTSTPAHFIPYNLSQTSTQFRTEFTAEYRPVSLEGSALALSPWSGLIGLDFRDSAIQAGYFVTTNSTTAGTARFKANRAPNAVNATDYGVFAQVSRSWRKVQESATDGQRGVAYKLDLGGRFDSNQVRPSEVVEIAAPNGTTVLTPVKDFGDFFSPRAAFAVTFGRRDAQGSLTRPLIVKTLFSRSFQQPSNYQRFASEPFVREIPSPGLRSEYASNVEVALDWEARSNDQLRFNASVYRAGYRSVLQTALVLDACCTPLRTGQFKPAGDFVVHGAEASMSAAWRRYTAYANYTYTRALSGDSVNDEYGDPLPFRVSVGDIARHKLNAGIEATAFGWLEGSLRLNAVGDRPNAFQGPQTTSRQNFREVPGYGRLNATFGARHASTGTTIQLALNNLLNQDIWDSGVRSAEIYGFVGRIPQPGFNWMVRAIWDFNGEGNRNR